MIVVTTTGHLYHLLHSWYILVLISAFSKLYLPLLASTSFSNCGCVSIGWDRFSQDIQLMIGRPPIIWWRIMWMAVTPIIIVVSPLLHSLSHVFCHEVALYNCHFNLRSCLNYRCTNLHYAYEPTVTWLTTELMMQCIRYTLFIFCRLYL